ncbi:MAG: AAA family ATPase, partial [Elusimicrobiota bacterium]|nr:AAA family ATPase [Elusimicrobiota bacterium]
APAIARAPSAQTPAAAVAQAEQLDPAAFQTAAAPSANERWAERAVALFDGMLERPRPLAVSAPEGGAPAPRLERPDGRFAGPYLLVALTLTDPGSVEGLNALLAKLGHEVGFRRDASGPIVRAEGVVVLRGAVPVENLLPLAKSPGVKGVSPIAAPRAAPYERPASETAFRAFVRGVAEKNPLAGALTTMPLHAFAVPAIIFPAFVGLALASPPAAAFLKPLLLGGTVALLGTFSFLAPLFRWIPAPLRAALAYAPVVVGGSLLVLNGATLAGVWIAANGLLGAMAAGKAFARMAAAPNAHLVDKLVNGAETSLHANLIGFHLLLVAFSSLLGVGALAGALGALSALTLLALSERASAPAVATAGPAARAVPPGMPGPDGPLPATAVAVRGANTAKPAPRQPFVAASRKVADLEKLVKSDPDAALALASDYLLKETDKRHEVRIGALRALEALPAEKALPVYLAFLNGAAAPGAQLAKQTSHDKWWYYQWEMLRRVAGQAPALTPASEELLAALRAAYKDRNSSVRLMAAHALLAFGQEPGPEVEPAAVVPVTMVARPSAGSGGVPGAAQRVAPEQPNGSSRWKWLIVGGLALLLGLSFYGGPRGSARDPSMMNRPAVTQQLERPAPAPSASVRPETTTPRSHEELTVQELERIAEAAERSARAAEEQNRLLAESQKKSGSGWIWTLFLAFAPILFMVWLFSKMARGGMGGGKGSPMDMNKAQTNAEKPSVRFHDVAGIDESMVEVEEIVDYLRNPGQYARLGARVPKGVLLEGPPGSGKTLLAKALAGETDANFISMSGSDFVQMFVGVGAARVRDLFEQAKKNRPAVIFIDEIDAVGKARGSGGPMGGNDEREQTINAMLAAMDGFTDSTGIIVVAATNRADTLDPALTRPGRFDRKIHVGAPEVIGREAILALHARKIRLAPDADLRYVARRTAGLTGAFLENVAIEAARLAARRGGDMVTMADLDEGVDRATIGAKRSLKLSDELKLRIARHESGHVLANLLNERPELRQPTNKVTIVPHGTGALGFAEMGSPEGDSYLYTKSQLEARLDHALGGLVAERLYYGEWSTGPGSDLQYATRIARTMVQQLGMDEGLGLAQTGADPNDPFGRQPFGDGVGDRVHEATKRVIQESYERVLKRLEANRDRLDAMSAALMDKETLIDTEISQYAFGELPEPPAGAAGEAAPKE